MEKGLKGEDIIPHEYVKQFKSKLELYVNMCDIVLSCDEDSERANGFITKIMKDHNFKL